MKIKDIKEAINVARGKAVEQNADDTFAFAWADGYFTAMMECRQVHEAAGQSFDDEIGESIGNAMDSWR